MAEGEASTIEGTVVDVDQFTQVPSDPREFKYFKPGLTPVTWKYIADGYFPTPFKYVKALFGNEVKYNCYMGNSYNWYQNNGAEDGVADGIDTPDAWD